jgi:hypothetical protein
MRKIIILSASALAIFLAMPQMSKATTVQNEITVIQDKAVKYQESTPANLPEPVIKSLTKDYAGYTIDKVFLGDDGTCKVIVSKGTAKNVVFFDARGEFVKIEKPAPVK